MKIDLRARGEFTEWREAAREALRASVLPRDINWNAQGGEVGLFDSLLPDFRGDPAGIGGGGLNYSDNPTRLSTVRHRPPGSPDIRGGALTVTPAFLILAEAVICHSDPARFDLAYRLLWRLQTQKHLLNDVSDPDIVRAHALQKAVGRDSHKMKAFVRFKEMPETGDRRRFIAWFEPEHFIVARTAPFFQRRFTDMDWIIATPKGSAVWDGDTLRTSDEPAEKPDIIDDTDDLWRTYFAHIFNPARLKVKMMQSEMPKKYWKTCPKPN